MSVVICDYGGEIKCEIRRVFSFALALIISLTTFVMPTSANEATVDSNVNILYSATGAHISDSLKMTILQSDITLIDSSEIQVAAVTSETGSNTAEAIIVTNWEGNTQIKDVLLTVNTTDKKLSGDYTSGGNCVIHGKAICDFYLGASYSHYYRPKGLTFSYEKKKSCTVNSMTVSYIIYGRKRTYPGEELIKTEEEYVISLTKSNPSENKEYSRNNPYPSGMVIDIAGSPLAGCYMTFTAVVDNKSDTYNMNLGG